MVQLHGAAQSASASYYWQATFGGYAKNSAENEGLGESLYASCEATDATTAVINLTKPSASVLGALALQAFAIASPKALEEFKADEGTLDEDTGFQPTGTFGTENPIGTGPFKLESWQIGDRLTLVRNEDYWDEEGKAKLDKLIIRPISDNAARLQALQTGEIQGYDLVEPQDVPTIEGDDGVADPRAAGVQRRLRDDQPQGEAVRQARGAAGRRTRARPAGCRGQLLRGSRQSWRRSSCRRASRATPTT